MPGRDKDLITKNGMPIPQSYNPQTEDWESYIGVSWGKTAGGLYVPVAVTDEGHVKVQQSGTILQNKNYTTELISWVTLQLRSVGALSLTMP